MVSIVTLVYRQCVKGVCAVGCCYASVIRMEHGITIQGYGQYFHHLDYHGHTWELRVCGTWFLCYHVLLVIVCVFARFFLIDKWRNKNCVAIPKGKLG